MNESIFYTLAEVAVALAGFSSIAAAFNLRGQNTWSQAEIRMLWFLIMDSFLILLFSLLPIPMKIAGVPLEMIWAICCALLGSWFLIANWIVFQGERRDRMSKKVVTSTVITPILYVISAIALLVGISMWLSALGILVPRGQALYVTGLIILVVFAALEFLFFVDLASRKQDKSISK